MSKERMTGEVIYIRAPEGTRARRDALRGRERPSDFDRRLYLEALERAEASQKSSRTPSKRKGRSSGDNSAR